MGDIREGMKKIDGDLVSRQAAIDAAKDWYDGFICGSFKGLEKRLEALPSAQPEIKTDRDVIYRQEAITAIQKAYVDTEGGTDKCAVWKNVGLTNALHIMQDLPPAQPEQDILSWLLAYHTKSFDLHGRYMPHEVIGWLVHDFANAYMAERCGDGKTRNEETERS